MGGSGCSDSHRCGRDMQDSDRRGDGHKSRMSLNNLVSDLNYVMHRAGGRYCSTTPKDQNAASVQPDDAQDTKRADNGRHDQRSGLGVEAKDLSWLLAVPCVLYGPSREVGPSRVSRRMRSVDGMTEILIDPPSLTDYARQILAGLGAPPVVAAEVAAHLVLANLSGHDSHGVQRIPQYAMRVSEGDLVPSALPQVVKENHATALIDAHHGFGQYSTAFAADWAISRASQTGIAAVAIRHSHHIGRVGHYAERAAAMGMVAVITAGAAGTGVGGSSIPGTTERFLGANPWTFAFPVKGDRGPVLVDVSTSTIAEGKVQVARARRLRLPEGSVIGPDGQPSTDPEDFYRGGSILPLGGLIAGHKGYGLALAAAYLGALGMIGDIAPTMIGASSVKTNVDPAGRLAGVFLAVIDPDAFGGRDTYAAMLAANLSAARRLGEITVPGEPERTSRAARSTSLALPTATWQALAEVATKVGVQVPKT